MTDKDQLQTLLERIEKLEKTMGEDKEKITTLENTNKELMTKLATAKVDSLTRKVEEDIPQPKVEEETTFDFDIYR